MTDRYTDKWGNEKEQFDLLDWSADPIWEYWEAEFEWLDCGADYEEQDIVAFKDDVCIEHYKSGKQTWYRAERFVIARVAGLDEGRVYFEAIHSEGMEPFEPDAQFSRKREGVSRYGVKRWPRDHSPRENRTEEQIAKSDFLKAARQEVDHYNSTGGNEGNPGNLSPVCHSRFLSDDRYSKSQKADKKTSWSNSSTGSFRP